MPHPGAQGLPAPGQGTNDPACGSSACHSVNREHARIAEEQRIDWPTALVLIAVIIAVIAVLTTYFNSRFSNK